MTLLSFSLYKKSLFQKDRFPEYRIHFLHLEILYHFVLSFKFPNENSAFNQIGGPL